jgi:hypothetical protein
MSSIRPLLRLSRRRIRRNLGRSTVVITLVALPVAALIATLSLVAGSTASNTEVRSFGQADAVFHDLAQTTIAGQHGELNKLPAGTRRSIVRRGGFALDQGQRRPAAEGMWLELDPRDPRLQGLIGIVAGRAPREPGEVLVSSDVRAKIGDTLRLDLPRSELRVVGRVDPRQQDVALVAAPGTFPPSADPAWSSSGLGTPTSDVFVDLPGDPATWPRSPSTGLLYRPSDSSSATGRGQAVLLSLSILVFVWCGLLASSALAIGTRRRRRELGLLGANGATSNQLRQAVVAEGVVLGFVGSVVGSLLGVATALTIDAVASRVMTGPPWQAAWPLTIVFAPVFGWLSATMAGALACRGVATRSIVDLLAGRVPPTRGAPRRLVAGVVAASACMGAALVLRQHVGLAVIGLVATVMVSCGALALVFLTSGALADLPSMLRRRGVAVRLAGRDLQRFGLRTSAAAAAMALTFSLATTIAAFESRPAATTTGTTAPSVPIRSQPLFAYGRQLVDGRLVQRALNQSEIRRVRHGVEGLATVEEAQGVADSRVIACSSNGAAVAIELGHPAPTGCATADVLRMDPSLVDTLPHALAAPLRRGEVVGWIPYKAPGVAVNDPRLFTPKGSRPIAPADRTAVARASELDALSFNGLVRVLVPASQWNELGLSAFQEERAAVTPPPGADEADLADIQAATMDAQRSFASDPRSWLQPQGDAPSPFSSRTTGRLALAGAVVAVVLLVLALCLRLVRLESAAEETTLLNHGATPRQRARVLGCRALLITIISAVPGVALTSIVVAIVTSGQTSLALPSWQWLLALLVGVPLISYGAFFLGGLRSPARMRAA